MKSILRNILHIVSGTMQASGGPDGAAEDAIDLAPVIYALGDIHGLDAQFGALLEALTADAERLDRNAVIVLLGDMVNRGPATREVVERVLRGPLRAGDRFVALRGNHEQMILDALVPGADRAFSRWLDKGGGATLQSYGLPRENMRPDRAIEAIGSRHLGFLRALPYMHIEQGRLFVHAGVMSGIPLEDQLPSTLMNVRKPFFSRPHGVPYTVVHGHTPTKGKPLIRPGRINVDTGAVVTGILTAGVFEPGSDTVRFLQATPAKDRPIIALGAKAILPGIPAGPRRHEAPLRRPRKKRKDAKT